MSAQFPQGRHVGYAMTFDDIAQQNHVNVTVKHFTPHFMRHVLNGGEPSSNEIGFHRFEVQLLSGARLDLNIDYRNQAGQTVTLSDDMFFHVDTTYGLYGKYYNIGGPAGEAPQLERIDPIIVMRWHIFDMGDWTLTPAFRIHWSGKLLVAEAGEYLVEMTYLLVICPSNPEH